MNRKKMEREIEKIYRDFMESYYLNHDLEKSLTFLDKGFTAIGTGKDERAEGLEEARKFFERDFTQGPNPIQVHYYSIKPFLLSENICILLSCYKLTTTIEGLPLELDHVRSTMVFSKKEDGWKIIHSHISLPFMMQKEGESFPLEALRYRNKLLQNIITKKKEELGRLMEELEKLATFDKITGIYNRSKLEEILSYEIERAKRYNHPLSLIMLDIDHFKEVNDTYGHLVGDDVLRDIATFVSRIIRKTDIFARWGGDEFVILCPSTDLSGACTLGEKIRRETEDHNFNIKKSITVSMGITQLRPEDDAVSFIQRADKLLYKAKNEGRNMIKTE